MKNFKLAPEQVNFLNPQSLGVLDDMFYRLPFPDSLRMEKLHANAGITTDAAQFLRTMQSDFSSANAMSDLREGWIHFLGNEMKVDTHDDGTNRKSNNPGRRSLMARNDRTKTPTASEDEREMVCYLHWNAVMRMTAET